MYVNPQWMKTYNLDLGISLSCLTQVMDSRQEQIQSKLSEVKRQREESLEEREELIRQLEIANQLTRRDEEDREVQKTVRRQEIDAQVLNVKIYRKNTGKFTAV